MPRWLAVESDPGIFNAMMDGITVAGSARFHDVVSLEPEMLAFLPQPVHALILLYPLTAEAEKFQEAQEKTLQEEGQEVAPSVFFMKQFIGNACATIAVLHVVANNTDRVPLLDGPLREFFTNGAAQTPEERGRALEDLKGISEMHENAAAGGQTEVPDREEKTSDHFVAFVHVEGSVYELDGRKSSPINHGATTPDTFLNDAAAVIRDDFMQQEPENVWRYAVMALCEPES